MSQDSPSTASESTPRLSFVVSILLRVVRGYQKYLSPLLGPSCRFHPTCSSYALGALQKYGLLRGGVKILWRILRCNPLCAGGFDPP